MLTEKQQDKFGREMEHDLHSAMGKAVKAPRQEIAAIQLQAAQKLLKDTEIATKLAVSDSMKTQAPEYKSDTSPEAAENHFNTVNKAFEAGLAKYEHLDPEKAAALRKRYGLKGKSWQVQIDLKTKN
jgi:hypothetical protein